MALKKKPVTGMKDILPAEMEIRDYVIGLIKETYRSFGFSSIETPCVEHIENLCSKQGGDNEKLIFKILKRGEKLKLAEAKEEADLVDGGLRYDLTLPLSRYYANHSNELPAPFKALQMGSVWRADRPQKGRYREFYQCDADVVGSDSLLNEVELMQIVDTVFSRFNIRVCIKINNRKILSGIAEIIGEADKIVDITVAIDKLDKIGLDNVNAELKEKGIHVCIDSNGGLWNEDVEKLFQLTDLVLLDIKEFNPARHQMLTGRSNEQTIRTATWLEENGKPFWLRYVLVPGYSDFEEDIRQLGEALGKYKMIQRVEILPYHTLGVHKYEAMEQEYKLKDVKENTPEQLEKATEVFKKYFTTVVVN